jgi:uncharacterized tellurite resistance protein B-like protein
MIRNLAEKISKAFAAPAAESDEEARESAIRMATAVLMTEVARSDHDFDRTEYELLLELIVRTFRISSEDAADLAEQANEAAEHHVSLHSFTQLLNANLSNAEKEHLVSLLWQVVFADGRLDKHEDALVLKISDLLYVSRGRVMRLKHDANPHSED